VVTAFSSFSSTSFPSSSSLSKMTVPAAVLAVPVAVLAVPMAVHSSSQ